MERSIPKNNKRRTGLGDKRVRENREKLQEGLLALLGKRPFEALTVREICSESKVGYTTFFRHFPSKEGLFDALIVEEIKQLTEHALPIYDSADTQGACLALCNYIDKHRSLWSALLVGGASGKVRDEMLKQSREVTATRKHPDSLPPELGTAMAVAVILELLSWWLRQTEPWPAQRIAGILYEHAILPSKP